jgi:hypothetical protein
MCHALHYIALLFVVFVSGQSAQLPSAADVARICQLLPVCQHNFATASGTVSTKELQDGLEFLSTYATQNRVVPWMHRALQRNESAARRLTTSAISDYTDASTLITSGSLTPQWELLMASLNVYKSMSSTGCTDPYHLPLLDEGTGQVICSCPSGQLCYTTSETSSTNYTFAQVVTFIAIALLVIMLALMIFEDLRWEKFVSSLRKSSP